MRVLSAAATFHITGADGEQDDAARDSGFAGDAAFDFQTVEVAVNVGARDVAGKRDFTQAWAVTELRPMLADEFEHLIQNLGVEGALPHFCLQPSKINDVTRNKPD